jgi:hypothetical protein
VSDFSADGFIAGFFTRVAPEACTAHPCRLEGQAP